MPVSDRREFAEKVEKKVSELNDLLYKAILNYDLKVEIDTVITVGIPQVFIFLSK